MTVIMKTCQLRQARLRRSLEITLSLSISDWLDDFINHQPNDELVELRVYFRRNRLIFSLIILSSSSH